jgi:hypothetical protein
MNRYGWKEQDALVAALKDREADREMGDSLRPEDIETCWAFVEPLGCVLSRFRPARDALRWHGVVHSAGCRGPGLIRSGEYHARSPRHG